MDLKTQITSTHNTFTTGYVKLHGTLGERGHRKDGVVWVTYSWVLTGVRGEVLEGPLDVLVRSQLPGEGRGLLAAEAQDAIVGG